MKTQLCILALLGVFILSSCEKNSETGVVADTTSIYVAGHQYDTSTGRDRSAVWTNGVMTYNTLSGNRNNCLLAIAVSGTDVYTTGFESQPAVWKCHVWKNGQVQYTLGDGYSLGSGIAVSGSDVYVAGFAYDPGPVPYYAMLWKNSGGPVNVLASSVSNAEANAIAINGTDIYTGGKESYNARVWKNGTPMAMNNTVNATVTGIAIAGSDVYAVGYTDSLRIRYWKNGVAVNIPTTGSAMANSIVVSNNDIYIAGTDLSGPKAMAIYWKNGTAVPIGDPARGSRANAIAIKGPDVYIAGEMQGAGTVSDFATIWKNGQATTIGNINSRARAIIVK